MKGTYHKIINGDSRQTSELKAAEEKVKYLIEIHNGR